MKIQDIIFLCIVVLLILRRDPKWAALAGIICLVFSIPLFSLWVFFTAERLTWYAAGFFVIAILFNIRSFKKK